MSLAELRSPQVVCRQGSIGLPSPRKAFPEQDLSLLWQGMVAGSLQGELEAVTVPELQLQLFTIENGTFFVGHGLDGAIVTEDHRPVHQTTIFCHPGFEGEEKMPELPAARQLGQIFIGFDGGWRNYFHWLFFGIAKSFLAARYLDPSVMIAIPRYTDGLRDGMISYSKATWQQSLALSRLSDRVTPLPNGVYQARKLHFFWTQPAQPTDIMYLDAFKDVFSLMADSVGSATGEPHSVYLVRSKSMASRLAGSAGTLVARVLARHGFEAVRFEGADLRRQIAIFANARRVVAAHGSGLANTLFHRGGLRVLELNSRIGGDRQLRPWFYVASAIRGHRYVSLDPTMADFSDEHLEAALAALEA